VGAIAADDFRLAVFREHGLLLLHARPRAPSRA
jgi:hypothetical protein